MRSRLYSKSLTETTGGSIKEGSGMSYMVILTAPQYWHGSFDAGASLKSIGQYAHDGYVSHGDSISW